MKTFILTFFVLTANLSHAEMMVDYFIKNKNNAETQAYISGLGIGYSWANAQLYALKRPMLYCQPGKLALETNNYVRFLEDGIIEQKSTNGIIEAILLDQLIKVFPCK